MKPELLPRPRFLERLAGTITWSSPLRVRVHPEWRGVVETFALDLERGLGWEVAFVSDACDLELLRLPELGPEEYQISTAECVRVEASTPAGAAYALTTLRQLGPAAMFGASPTVTSAIEVPRVVVQDGPTYGWRGVLLDVSRHFFDAATVCRLIDLLAAHRLNRLHLHLNDDQGWRVEIPAWPRLTEVGAIRRSSPVGHESDGLDDDVPHGGFYSAEDLAVIREHAARRCVQIIPEIDLPGHAQAAIAAYPELGDPDAPVEVWTRWGISERVLNVGPKAMAFAEEVTTYVASLFPGSPVHIGGDECPTSEWSRSDVAQALMHAHGFRDPRLLQGLFTRRVSAALQARGHEVVAWDDVLDAEVLPGTVITAWRSAAKAVEAAERGFDVVRAEMDYLYFDWLSSLNEDEPVAVARAPHVTPWEKVYGFPVVPEGLPTELVGRIRGAQAQLWTEYVTSRDRLDYMAFPRLAAFAEVAWGTATALEAFRPRLEAHLERLAAMGVRYRPLDPA